MKKGQVIRVISGFYDILCENKEYRVRGAGKLRQKETSPVVGDIVSFTPDGLLEEIHERKNMLVRPKVANVDQAFIISSLKDPDYSSTLTNKMLAIVEANSIKPIIIFTKRDLVTTSPVEEYKNNGYEVYEISNTTGQGVEDLKNLFRNKLSVFLGQTGSGKSSTINSISGTTLETQEISKSLGRGKHTTRVVQIIEWMGGQLIDTPGFSSFDFNLTPLQLSRSYHDFENASKECKFPRNCLHYKEEDCEVKRRVENNLISSIRYNDYIKLLKEVINENN